MACSKSPKASGFCNRRAILFVGISVLPLIQLKAESFESLGIEEPVVKALEQKQEEKQNLEVDAPSNPILSLLNGIGILSAGVLGALYALARNENTTSEATIALMKNNLNKSEEAIISLKKAYESKLANERDALNKKLKTANEDKQALTNQLNLATGEITRHGKELKDAQRLVEDLNIQVQSLQTQLAKAGENNTKLEEKLHEKLYSMEVLQENIASLGSEIKVKEDSIRNLESTVAEKESQLEKWKLTYEQTKDELDGVNFENASLRVEALEKQQKLGEKTMMVDDLNAQVSLLTVQKDDLSNQLDCVRNSFDDFKSSSNEKSAIDAKLLGDRKHEIHQLKEKIDFTLKELDKSQVLVDDLTHERDELKKSLNIQLKNVETLKHELKSTEELMGKSRNEVSDLEKQLEKSRNLCMDLEGEISMIQTEFSNTKESFKLSLDEAKRNTEVLTNELVSMREVLKNTKNEKRNISRELEAALENGDSLQNELVDVYKKAERANNDLKEEKKNTSSLTNEIQALEKQVSKDKESRKSLEMGLEETTRSLDEMNRNALILSKELEDANAQISTLEAEKELIYKTLDEQKQASQEARENMEDAQNLLMRLGEERLSLKKRGMKLEEELAAAKGEILRLRSEMNSPRGIVNNNNDHSLKEIEPEKKTKRVNDSIKKVESEGNSAAVLVKKSSRRKKDGSKPDSS